ncbi:hydrolase [Weissella viridescens]|uniref:HAD superfamily hydrolase n=1 Tax=Weissella viridescens TaxID=1629 RepID=A0A0R2H3D1_WEIVI|nr:HAD-IIB family hydrolase [Weissella viridescens]KRN46891.1 HAD superfamily hydrolase [Weissella viridescens]GEA94234.1 hydrolase [Weissella viridescens]SUP58975.1 Sugar phosphatase SupH [Weissella viridescens]
MTDIKMIATDLDGTFFNDQRQVNEPKFAALLDYFDQHDMHFVIATGNDQPLVDKIFAPFLGRFDYVMNNGAQVSTRTGQHLREAYFQASDLPVIQNLIEGQNMHFRHGIIFNGVHDSYMLHDYIEVGDLYEDILWYFPKLKYIDRISEIPEDETIVKVIFSADPDEANQFITLVNANYQENYHATTSGYGAIDVIPANVNKATGLDFLLDFYGLNASQLMTLGDGFNDLEMLEYAAKPKSMPNGDTYIKDHFPQAVADNNHDGVLDTIVQTLNITL